MIKINESSNIDDVKKFLEKNGYDKRGATGIYSYGRLYREIGKSLENKKFNGLLVKSVSLRHFITFFNFKGTFRAVLDFDIYFDESVPLNKRIEFSVDKKIDVLVSRGLKLFKYPLLTNRKTQTDDLPIKKSEIERYIYQTIEKDIPKAVNYFKRVLQPDKRKGRI